MKKSLLLASAALLSVGSAFAVTDGQTYEPSTANGSTVNCKNVWIIDRGHAEADYLASIPGLTPGKYRTAAVYDGVVYIGSSLADDPTVVDSEGNVVDCAGVDMYKLEDGSYIGKLKVTLDGTRISGLLCANQVGIDSFGNLYIAPYVSSSTYGYKVYSVNKTTGEAVLAAELPMTENGRIDYCDVIGDITRTEAKCTIMAAAASPATTAVVYRWVSEKGSAEWEGGWAGGDDSFVMTDLYPANQTAWGTAPTVKIVLGSGETAYDASLFYVDGFNTFPTLYDENGSIIESFASAEDCVPENAGVNGVAEFSLAGRDFIVYGNNQHTGSNGCNEIWVSELGENMSFEGMKHIWMLPKDGMNPGKVSDGGTRVHSIARELLTDATGKEGTYLLTYKCNAGFGVYLIAEEGFNGTQGVEGVVADAATITVAGGVIAVSAEASEIAIYNAQGQLVNKVNNASQVAAPAAAGAYIVKATVAGTPVVKKVVL